MNNVVICSRAVDDEVNAWLQLLCKEASLAKSTTEAMNYEWTSKALCLAEKAFKILELLK